MSPAEIEALALFLNTVLPEVEGISPDKIAQQLAEKYVMFERTDPRHPPYCDECGFSGWAAGHHPKCTKYDKSRRAVGDTHGFGRTT